MDSIAPMEALRRVLDGAGHPIDVVEDMAQAQGARRNGRAAGSLGRVAATSFYPGKNLGADGDAGAAVTDDEVLAEKLVALRNYGSPRKYQHPEPGFNGRLDTLQAAVLRAKLPRLSEWNALRRAAAERYDAWLASSSSVPKLLLTFQSPAGLQPSPTGSPAVIAWARANNAELEVAELGPAGHHAPEDVPHEIGQVVAGWLERHALSSRHADRR